ncbi:MAG: hypothetical protein ACKODX_10235 [Gemmata sp.]
MPELERAIEQVLEEYGSPAARRLLLDCWELGARHGEAEGLRFLAVYRRSFEEYARYACELLEKVPG